MASILWSCIEYFCSAAFGFLLYNATSKSGEPFEDACCDRTAPMAQLDASVLSMKRQLNRANYNIGAIVNAILNAVNAVSYTSVHTHA